MRRYLILLLAVLAGCSATNGPTTSSSSHPTSIQKPATTERVATLTAERLATLDGANAANPAQYDAALGQLSRRCSDHPDPERIADLAVGSRDKLAQAGISDSLMNILWQVNNAAPGGGNLDQGCAMAFDAYVFFRRSFQ
jgi:hypothetical protein